MIEFHCKNCGQKLSVQDQHSGKRVKCPKCGSVGFVPDKSDKIKFHCENCGQSISVPQNFAGKKGKCPKCKNVVVVPTSEATPVKSTSMVSFTCSMCDETVQVPETSIGKTIECPGCGSYIETSSGAAPGESNASTDEDLYDEETDKYEKYEESVGVDRRIIVGISAVAAVVVVGLIILVAVLRSSRSRPAGRPEELRTQRQVTETDLQPVTSDTQPTGPVVQEPPKEDGLPEEPIEAVPHPKLGDVVTNSISMKLVYIPDGSFMMGSGDSTAQLAKEYMAAELAEFPQHQVSISQGFWMGQTEITQGQYKSVMDAQPWSGKPDVQESTHNPAVYVSWNDAVEFCSKLSQREGKTYRLPTEAEWEYACRAGTTTRLSFGDDGSSLGEYAWYADNAYKAGQRYAHSVGQKKPNPWGLYDMHGNVIEWCSDWYDQEYYTNSPRINPTGPSSGELRSLRGGSWGVLESALRCSSHSAGLPVGRGSRIGFRVVCSDQGKTSREEEPSHPETSVGYFNRGKAYADKNQYDEAISDFDKAIEIDPKYADAYRYRGIVYLFRHQYDQAIADYNKAIEINPRNVGAYLNRAGVYVQKSEFDKAISDCNKAIEINLEFSTAYHNRAAAYFLKGDYDKAWDDVHKAESLGDHIHPALLNALRKASGRRR